MPALHRLRLPLVLLLASLPALVIAQTERFVELRQAAKDWAAVKDQLMELETTWQWERELLQASLDASEAEELRLEAAIASLQAESQASLRAQDNAVSAAQRAEAELELAKQSIASVAERLVAWRPALPPRLSRSLNLPYQTLGDDTLSDSERLNAATSIITRALAFNQTISTSQERLQLPEGPSDTVFEVAYWGLSHAYALDRSAPRAFFGSPRESGWIWHEMPQSVQAVSAAIDIRKGEQEPRFVELPVRLRPVDAPDADANPTAAP